MSDQLTNDLFIKACYRQAVARTPVWMMRQAGRYLPEYRAVRSKHDFLTMYKTPELAAEVTLQPVDLVGVDAAILFSDILVIPEAMGMTLKFLEGRGPVFLQPLRSRSDFNSLREIEPARDLGFVMEAIRLVRRELNGRVPLIGFSGAPWTLATYMVEGQGSKNFTAVKTLRYSDSKILHHLLKKITAAVIGYLETQIEAGAQAIQLFDTWAGLLDADGFREFALPYVAEIFSAIRRGGVPLIYFAKGAGIWLEALSDCGADVLGLDWTIDIGEARQKMGDRFALQGNLDPVALYSGLAPIRRQVKNILEKFGSNPGHIFNLGHGILPDVPPENARAFVQAVKEESIAYHK